MDAAEIDNVRNGNKQLRTGDSGLGDRNTHTKRFADRYQLGKWNYTLGTYTASSSGQKLHSQRISEIASMATAQILKL